MTNFEGFVHRHLIITPYMSNKSIQFQWLSIVAILEVKVEH